MKPGWIAIAIAAVFFAFTASAEPSPQTLALAERYMAATGGMYQTMQEQAYAAAGAMGDTPLARVERRSLQEAVIRHHDDLAAIDGAVATLMTQTLSDDELSVAVAFLESPQGRSITGKKQAYFAQMFAPDRPALSFSPEESAALAAYDKTPEAISLRTKAPALLARTMALTQPVVLSVSRDARRIFCHQTLKCNSDGTFDERGGPNITRP